MSIGTASMVDGEVTWSLVDSVHKVVRGRRILLATTLLGTALGVLMAATAKPVFTAEAVFLPPKNTDFAQGAAGASAILLGGSGDESSDMYLGLLASRTVQDDVIDHLGLMSKFKAKTPGEARNTLIGSSRFGESKNAFITIEIKSGDPRLATDIANSYMDALYRINGQMVESASAHRRAFFEEQLASQKEALAKAELDLKTTQERTGLIFPAGEAQTGLSTTSALQGQINAAEARLAGLLIGGTEQNPEVVQARGLVNQLRLQLARQQADTSSGPLPSNKRLPGLTLEYAQKEREVKLREGIYDTLVQQYEKARLSSIDPGPQLQIVDRAIVPERKSGPNRRLIAIAGILLGSFAGLAYVLLFAPLRKLAASLRLMAQTGKR